jgi:hypothetical protein
MKSRASRQHLDTRESRKHSLATRINHKIWPYISFTNSPAAIQDLAEFKDRRRGVPQTLTVLDPNARIADGLLGSVGLERRSASQQADQHPKDGTPPRIRNIAVAQEGSDEMNGQMQPRSRLR